MCVVTKKLESDINKCVVCHVQDIRKKSELGLVSMSNVYVNNRIIININPILLINRNNWSRS